MYSYLVYHYFCILHRTSFRNNLLKKTATILAKNMIQFIYEEILHKIKRIHLLVRCFLKFLLVHLIHLNQMLFYCNNNIIYIMPNRRSIINTKYNSLFVIYYHSFLKRRKHLIACKCIHIQYNIILVSYIERIFVKKDQYNYQSSIGIKNSVISS